MTTQREIRPQAGPQTQFLSSNADIVVYGGAAGGGKTWGLLLDPLRHKDNSAFSAVFFRRTFPQVTNPGGMWDESEKLYPLVGAKGTRGSLFWRFPSGATFRFAHLQREDSKYDWQGAQVPFLGFDELTHFTESQFFYLLSRNRSMCGVVPYVRATTNPDADSWVANFIEWWIDDNTGYPLPDRAGIVRYFSRDGDRVIWGDHRGEVLDKAPHLRRMAEEYNMPIRSLVKSFTFIPAKVYDNKELLRVNPEYLANLLALDLVEQERLLGGNWKIRPASGKLFNRGWYPIVDAIPQGGEVCRFWDFAATTQELAGDDPDYTAGVRMRLLDGAYYVEDVICERMGPAESEQVYVQTAWQDAREAKRTGAAYKVRFELEPGSAALRDAQRMIQALAGLDVAAVSPEGDKIQRAKPLAAQSLAGNVFVLSAEWTEAWLKHMHHQPDLDHDDMMDASSGAFNSLTNGDEADGGFSF